MRQTDKPADVVVIGLGQELRADDAVGLEVVRRWQQQYPQTAASSLLRVEISSLPGLQLLDLLEGADAAILVDALQSGRPPGTILHLDHDALAASETSPSAHGWGVAETLALAEQLGTSLPEIILLAIEGESVAMGPGISATVEAALPEAVERLQDLVSQHLQQTQPETASS